MSDPRTAPLPVTAGPAPQPDADPGGEVLHRADGVELLGEVPGSGYRRPPALARRGDGQVVTLTPLLQQVLRAVDGNRTVAEVAEAVGEATGRLVRADDVATLVARSLRPLGLLRRADGSEPELRRARPLLALRLRRVVTDPHVTRRITAPFAALFHPVVVLPVVVAFTAVATWVLFSEGLAAATAQAFRFPALFLAVVVVTVLSAGFHEFGHAAAARYGGSTPGAMGFGLYLFWPAFYTDVTDSYRLGRAGRVRTDLGGLYFNALVVLVTFGVWELTGWHAVLLVVATQVLQMVRQLAPLLRFDGYHVLADLTGVPDLYQRIGPVLSALVPWRRRPGAEALKPWARAVVTLWVLAVVPLMAVSTVLMVVSLPRLLGTAWASVRAQAAQVAQDAGAGDVLGVVARSLAVVAVALPVLGIALVVGRLVRRVLAAVRRRTGGRPVQRGLAALVAAAVVLGLVWVWWPAPGRYAPVRAYEGGTVLDAVPARSASGLSAGARGNALTIWPGGGALPTADRPALALVLTPAGGGTGAGGATAGTARTATPGTGTPTWVFPFDRPLPPRAGDNQALAVNVQDGAVRYAVSFALVWADGSTAVQRNEAYALASCTGCTTVAVAFQVVLVLGSVHVVAPQNLAAAVNYGCVSCLTYALAEQLVQSVPGQLGEQDSRDLATVWASLAAFGQALQDVPLTQIQARLQQYEDQITAIVRHAAGSSVADGTAPGTTAGTTSSAAGTGAADSSGTVGSEATVGSAGTGGATAATSSTARSTTGAAPPASSSTSGSSGAAGTTAATTSSAAATATPSTAGGDAAASPSG